MLTRVHNPNGISIGSAVFAQFTSECLRACRGTPFPKNCPFSRGFVSPFNTWFLGSTRLSIPNGISIGYVQSFCTAHGRKYLYFIMGAPFPKIAPSNGVSGPHLIHDSLCPSKPTNPNGISIGSAVFVGLTSMTDRQTDRSRYSVGNNRPHLRVVLRCGLIKQQFSVKVGYTSEKKCDAAVRRTEFRKAWLCLLFLV